MAPHTDKCASHTGLQCDCFILEAQSERAKFQSWILAAPMTDAIRQVILSRMPNGDYKMQQTFSAWQAWQARANLETSK